MNRTLNIAVFASGTGTNFQSLVNQAQGEEGLAINMLVTNKASCGAAEYARKNEIRCVVIDNHFTSQGKDVLTILHESGIDKIVLAGFLKLIPRPIVEAYNNKMINIHPSLLPEFGGKGMYGRHVHEAVVREGAKRTGITIHLVDAEYDKGEIVFQADVAVDMNDSAEDVEKKVRELEKKHFAVETLKYFKRELGH